VIFSVINNVLVILKNLGHLVFKQSERMASYNTPIILLQTLTKEL